MADNTTYCTFEELLATVDPELRPVCTALRDVITRLHQDHLEIVWKNQRIASYGIGPRKMTEHYAYIAPQKRHVNLGFYHGATAADPKGMLEGTGKRLRHIKMRTVAEAKRASVRSLIAEAIAERKG